ncbi:uncharacterized protein LOC129615414 [Condylostylus longicornis]|uniref:uncharacterized protein LOC129615414 n=1 Tax=Condylostylus longicornis TaxID=2530218 RepID=UPI00244DB344|nr:uncharacterized protein LOC129615414 [Condylostylus longicornis]
MHYLIGIREKKNNSELILHHALTKCNPSVLWRRNRNLDKCQRQKIDEGITKRKNDDRNDFLDTYECHFGFDPDMIVMDEFSNNYRRDSLPMECPLSSLSSSNFGDQQQIQSTINSHSMSYIHLQGIQEYGINHPLSESSTTLLVETLVSAPPPIPPPPSQADIENKYISNNFEDNPTKQNRTGKSVTFSMDQNLNNNIKKKSTENHNYHNTSPIPFQFDNDRQNNNNYSNLQTILRGLVAIFALSIHSLFEGLAVGLEKNISSIWYLFLAIGTHKFVIIFCIGIELVAAKLKPLWILIYIIGFAMVTPFGILIGSLIAHSYETDKNEILSHTEITSEGILLTIAAMLQAVSAGTLLYVIFFEIMVKERHHHHHFEAEDNNYLNGNDRIGHLHHSAESLIQCFAVGCGFMFMVGIHALIYKTPHRHVH